jgi:Tfp pilus assembly protein FimT
MEALCTTALMGILVAIGMPRFRGMSGPYATRAAAEQLAAEFSAARLRAISTNSSVRITYASASRTYRVERNVAGTWKLERAGQIPTGVTITYPDAASPPTFNSRGLPAAGVNIPLVYSDGLHNRTVAINALGKVTVS